MYIVLCPGGLCVIRSSPAHSIISPNACTHLLPGNSAPAYLVAPLRALLCDLCHKTPLK